MAAPKLSPQQSQPNPGVLDRLARAVALVGLVSLVALAAITIIDIVGREFFSQPVDGFSDIADLVVVFAAASCFPASLAQRDHVAVRAVGRLHWRLRECLELLGQCVLFIVFVLMVWQLAVYAIDVYDAGQSTWLMQIPVWPLWSSVVLIMALCLPIQAAVIGHQFSRCLSAVPLASEHAEQLSEQALTEESHGGG